MANSISVDIGFKSVKNDISQVLESVKDLNAGVKDVVLGMKGLNSETKTLNKRVAENNFSRAIVNLRAYSGGLKDVFGGIKTIGSEISGLFKKQFDFVSGMALNGDRIAKNSRLVGLSVKEYQSFASAAQKSGMTVEEMNNAFKRFNVNLGKARGGDKAAFKAFDSILGGKSLSSFKDTASLIASIADGYNKLDSAEQKAFVTSELFGEGGFKVTNLLSGGGENVRKLIKEYEDAGGGYSEQGAKNAEEFDDQLQKLFETFNSLKIKVAEEVFPTFIELFKTASSYIKENSSTLIPKIKDFFVGFADFVKNLLPKVPKILDTILSIVDSIGTKNLVIGSVVLSILPAVVSIAMGIATIVPLIGKLFVGVKFIYAVVTSFITAIKVISVALGAGTLAPLLLVVAAVVSWGIAIKSVISNLNLVPDAIDWIAQTVGDFCSMAADKFLGLFHGLGDLFLGIGQSIFNFCNASLSTIFGFVDKIKGAFKGIFGGFPDKIKSFFGIQDSVVQSTTENSASNLGAAISQTISESHTTTTSRFAVDFKNMPRGVQVTVPDHGDFDYSRGYVLAGM